MMAVCNRGLLDIFVYRGTSTQHKNETLTNYCGACLSVFPPFTGRYLAYVHIDCYYLSSYQPALMTQIVYQMIEKAEKLRKCHFHTGIVIIKSGLVITYKCQLLIHENLVGTSLLSNREIIRIEIFFYFFNSTCLDKQVQSIRCDISAISDAIYGICRLSSY